MYYLDFFLGEEELILKVGMGEFFVFGEVFVLALIGEDLALVLRGEVLELVLTGDVFDWLLSSGLDVFFCGLNEIKEEKLFKMFEEFIYLK